MNILGLSLIFVMFFTLIAAEEDYCDPALCRNVGFSPHVGCNNDGSFGENCTEGARLVEMTDDIKAIILYEHNNGRNMLAGGELEGYETAARMATMQWDDELAQLASLNVRKCYCGTDDCRNTKRYRYVGQNACEFGYTGKENQYDDLDIVQNDTLSWFRQYPLANMDVMRSYPYDFEVYKHFCHFALFMAEKNNHVGCAGMRYMNGRFNMFLFTCNYATAVLRGFPIYREGPPASGCRTGNSTEYPNLCSPNEKYSSFIMNG